MVSNRVKERIGINHVSSIVETQWECGWQEYAPQNDDAIDGVILMRRGSNSPFDTGGVVFVQVKCGANGYRQDQKQYPDHIGVQLGEDYISRHRDRWRRVPGPCVLVFVDDSNRREPKSWWTNLRDQESYSPTNSGMLLVPKKQNFSHQTKGVFHKLCGFKPADRLLERINMDRDTDIFLRLGKSESIRNDAWNFYKNWRGSDVDCTNPSLGKILVNRVGWKHLTRKGRRFERIVQSWLLLGTAKQIIKNCEQVFNLGRARKRVLENGEICIDDYLGLRARVSFSYRDKSVVQIVLKRKRIICPNDRRVVLQKIWFYSVYELRRGAWGE